MKKNQRIKTRYLLLLFVFFINLSATGQQPVNADLRTRPDFQEYRVVIPENLSRLFLVTVPPLEGMRYDFDRIVTMLDSVGLQLGGAVPVISRRPGFVENQSPDPGERILPGDSVFITYGIQRTLTRPPDNPPPENPPPQNQTVTVVNYIGMPVDRAVARMPFDRVQPGVITEVFADSPTGIVVDQFPKGQEEVDENTRINLDVSKGPQPNPQVQVPDLRNRTLQEAGEILQEAGLFVNKREERESDRPQGIVIDQSPNPGRLVPPGSGVDIVYTVSPQPPPPAEDFARIPDVRGMPVEEAIRVLKEHRLRYSVQEIKQSNAPEGIVLDQEPKPGTLHPPATTVYIMEKRTGSPPWIFWAGGVVAAGLLGGLAGRMFRPGRRKRPLGKKDASLDLKPVWDTGKQTIESTESGQMSNHVHLKYIADQGIQTIKSE